MPRTGASRPAPLADEELISLEADLPNERVDQFLARHRDWTRAQVQRWIEAGLVTLDGRPLRPSQRLHPGACVQVRVPPPETTHLEAEEIPLRVVYDDRDVLVVDKPAGLVVHPAPGHETGTLVHGVLNLAPELRRLDGSLRPGIVHRLDKDTSGLMVVAKTERGLRDLSQQNSRRTMLKEYVVLVNGIIEPPEGIIEAPIARDPRYRQKMAVVASGRPARTRYRTIERLGHRYTLIAATLETGRTHQIRVHFSSLGHPVIGDRTYGDRSSLLHRQFLHASRLGLHLPSNGEWREFESPLPAELSAVLERARSLAARR